jgi:hypothetical protein
LNGGIWKLGINATDGSASVRRTTMSGERR